MEWSQHYSVGQLNTLHTKLLYGSVAYAGSACRVPVGSGKWGTRQSRSGLKYDFSIAGAVITTRREQ